MNRMEERLHKLKIEQKKAFITYMTAGLPDYAGMKAIIEAQAEAGCDIIELGIPFSDPVADGPVIQAASYKAICQGVNLTGVMEAVAQMRESGMEIPLVFMMYYNTVLNYGVGRFAKKCEEIGVDGLIIPDLPYEEQGELKAALEGTNVILIQLVSPVSADRIPMILKDARGFVYCVSSMGVTGQENTFHKEVIKYLSQVKEHSDIPVMMGFGIRTAKDVEPMKQIIDGAIVGSHFIQLMEETNYSPDAVREYVKTFKNELNQDD